MSGTGVKTITAGVDIARDPRQVLTTSPTRPTYPSGNPTCVRLRSTSRLPSVSETGARRSGT